MYRAYRGNLARITAAAIGVVSVCLSGQGPTQEVGVVSHVQVLSSKVEDVSTLEAWRRSWLQAAFRRISPSQDHVCLGRGWL